MTNRNVARIAGDVGGRVAYLDAIRGGYKLEVYFDDVLVFETRYGNTKDEFERARSEAGDFLAERLPLSIRSRGWTFDLLRLDVAENAPNVQAWRRGLPRT